MPVDFLSILNNENSRFNDETGETELIIDEFSISDEYEINKPCRIICKGPNKPTIKCSHFNISSHSVVIDGIAFDCSVNVNESDNLQISNCIIKYSKMSDGGLFITGSKSVNISHVEITKTDNIPGLYITQNCTVTADNLTIFDLNETLLVLNSSSRLFLQDSELHHTKANAIYVSSRSHIELCRCQLYETEYPAIFIAQSSCKIENNKISAVRQNGISLNTVDNFVVSNNEITGISGSAIAVLDDSEGVAYNNVITKVGGNGIYVFGNSTIKAYRNRIEDNQFPGIAILMKCNAKLYHNKIANIIYSGICVRGANKVRIRKCQISSVQECGISISDTNKCIVTHNDISDCKIASVEVYNSSRAIVRKNKIFDIGNYAFLVYAGAHMNANFNDIQNVGSAMVKMCYKGGGSFMNNSITNCQQQKEGNTASMYFFKGNSGFRSVTNDEKKIKKKRKKNDNSENIDGEDDSDDKNKEDESDDENILIEPPYTDKTASMCIRCNQKPRNCFILDCSHRVFCEDCAQQAFENKELCPLCRFPIVGRTTGFDSGDDDGLCVICSENSADCIIMPCGHMGFCQKCLSMWYRKNKTCPTCRTDPSFFKKIIQDI